jgi:hypothetical protein
LLSNNTNSTSTCSGTKTKINLPKQNVKHKTQTRNILNNRILSSSSCITVSDYINCKRLIGKTLLNNNNDTNKSNLTNKKSRNSKQSSVIFRNSIDKNKTCAMLSHLKGTFKVSRNTTKPKELINKTNGIVQGMSGSPIIQDDKIIGAVTHVVVDNPHKGYGIFITNMLEEAEN